MQTTSLTARGEMELPPDTLPQERGCLALLPAPIQRLLSRAFPAQAVLIRKARLEDLEPIQIMLATHPAEVFAPGGLQWCIKAGEVRVGLTDGWIRGIILYRHSLSRPTIIECLFVASWPTDAKIAYALLQAVENECLRRGKRTLRLKWPQPGPIPSYFPRQAGFRRVAEPATPGPFWEKTL